MKLNKKFIAVPAIALAASLGLADTLGHHSTFMQAMRRLGNLTWARPRPGSWLTGRCPRSRQYWKA